MKYFFLGCWLLPLVSIAQRDFDYTVYTSHAKMPVSRILRGAPDTVITMSIERKVQKEADVLKVINLTNTGDCNTYSILYVGCQLDKGIYYICYEGWDPLDKDEKK